MKRAIEQPIEEEELLIEVRTSVGRGGQPPTDGDDAATLLRLADVAMYAAKENARRRLDVRGPAGPLQPPPPDPRRRAASGPRRPTSSTFAYQPQQDLETGAITAVEALVRWSHHKHGMVPPDEFIPVAEQTGLIIPLTDYVLTRGAVQQALWRRRGSTSTCP